MSSLEDDSSSVPDDGLFEVESILDMKDDYGIRKFYIKWKNYEDRCENTWEPEINLNCPDLLEQFLKKRKEQPPQPPSLRLTIGSKSALSSHVLPAKRSLAESKQVYHESSKQDEKDDPTNANQKQKLATGKFKSIVMSSPILRNSDPPSAPRPTNKLAISARSSRDPRLSHKQKQPQPSPTSHIPTERNATLVHTPPQLPSGDTEPVSWGGSLITNQETPAQIQIISIPTKCPRGSAVKEFLRTSEKQNGANVLRLTAFIKTRILEKFFNFPACLLDLNRVGQNQISYGKLLSFLHVNDVAALVHLDERPQDVLAVVYCSEKIANGWKLGTRSTTTLLGIYLEQMPKYPQFPRETIELKDWPLFSSGSSRVYDWHLLLTSLQFPAHLIQSLCPETYIEIHGNSGWATMLQSAYHVYKKAIKRESPRIILFDRSDDAIFKMDLYKYKRSNWPSMFWQFGLPTATAYSIPPPTESFPRCSGGFFFTDIENIVCDPSILQRISDAVVTLNSDPLTLSRWRFVLKHDVIDQLRNLFKTTKDAQKIQSALVNLSVFLNENKCEIMRDWAANEDIVESTAKWAEGVARRYHDEYEYFVLVDDIGSMDVHIGCLDQRPSKDLVRLFNVPD